MAEPKQQKMVVMASEARGSHNLICESWRKVEGWGSERGWPPESQKNYGEMWGDMGKYGEIWDMLGFKHQKFRHV